ncbi:MAG: porin, partial [Hydrogenophaga sp.]|uniref:porin n=1 Tax=Hydrogenophaga sp. TaxID=1904254 RepID=UPI0025BE9F9F
MKKSLVALAVLATTGAALAQSNVTLYGRIDTSIGSNKVNGVSSTQMFSGNLSSTRWGLRGS